MSTFKSTFYNTFYLLGHPALGAIAAFTLIGIWGEFDSEPLAVAFVLYSIMWLLLLQVLEFLGWKHSV